MATIRITYERWTPEDLEIGDTDDKGWIDEDGIKLDPDDSDESIADQAVRIITRHGAVVASAPSWQRGCYYTQEMPDEDWTMGTTLYRSYHLDDFLHDELVAIHERLTTKG